MYKTTSINTRLSRGIFAAFTIGMNTNTLDKLQEAQEKLNAGRKMLQQAATDLVRNSSSIKMAELRVMVTMCEKLEADFKAAVEEVVKG